MADNILLRHQPLTILQQLEELRNWHKEQERKLNHEKQPKKETLAESKFDKTENKQNVNIVPELTQYRNLNSSLNFDEMPIRAVNINFNEVKENNIIPNEYNQPSETEQINEKPKFQFLRKGEGIARFRMGPKLLLNKAVKRKKGLSLASINKCENNNINVENKKSGLERVNDVKENDIPTLNSPDLKLDFKNWKSIFSSGKAEEIVEKAICNNQLELFQPNSSIDSSTASIMEKLIAVGRKHLKEREELRVFETMEQHILDSSFCSTSSYVAKLMENAVISTPVKNADQNCKSSATLLQVSNNPSEIKRQESTIENTPFWIKPINESEPIPKSESAQNSEDLEQSLHVRFADKVNYKSFVEYSQSVNNSSQRESRESKEFDESKEWKEDSGDDSICCSQCSTAYSSSDEDVRGISPPVKPPELVQNHRTVQEDIKIHERNIPLQKLDVADLKTSSSQGSNEKSDMFPPVLSAKLKELEDEIKIFREENSNIIALRESLEKKHKQLQQEKKKFQQEKKKFFREFEEEKKKISAQVEEEKQKLAKEKFIFEKYSKSLTKNPSKEERKEIQGLREQLSEMREELNKKESRWGAAQARVRNQVKLLEEDNKKLREEVDSLRKQAKHWEFWNQRKKVKPFNNTRLIHAINDHISNIPIEDGANALRSSEESDYFKQKSGIVKSTVIDQLDSKNKNNVRVIKENVTKNNETKGFNYEETTSNQNLIEPYKKQMVLGHELSRELDKSPTSVTVSSESERSDKNKQNDQTQDRDHQYSKEKGSQMHLLPNSSKGKYITDGSLEEVYPNGNVKKVNPITGSEKTIYFNGDVEEITSDGTVKYYFSESRIWHTTFVDGLEILDFPNGQVEKRHINGIVEIIFPNNNKKLTYPDGSQEIFYADGTKLKIEANKTQVLSLPNGQKEIHTEDCKRREYPDGTVKTLYPDGTTETVYSNGRVRLKDKHGNLIMDSGTLTHSRL